MKLNKFYEENYGKEIDFNKLKKVKDLSPLKNLKKELVKKYCKGLKILELGCGLGEYIAMFSGELYGSDISFNALKKARLFSKAQFFQANAENLPLKNESFDCIILPDIIEHVENDENLIDELNRIVKKNGRVIIITPYSYKFETRECDLKLWNRVGEGGDLRKYGLELTDRFLKRNFNCFKIRFIGGPLTNLINKIKIKILKRKGYNREDILSGEISEVKNISLYSKILYLVHKLDYFFFGRLRGHYMLLIMDKK